MNIVILDGFASNPNDFSWEPLEAFGSLTVYDRTKPEEVIARAKDAEILIINKIDMTDDVISNLPKLKYIGILATGYNNIDTESAHRHGIVVCNIPSYSTESVVQMTFAHILNITNQVAHYASQNRTSGEGGEIKWSKNPDFCYWDTPLPEIAGKTMGIIGLGHIGMRVAQVAMAFGLKIKERKRTSTRHWQGHTRRFAKQIGHRELALPTFQGQLPFHQRKQHSQDETWSHTYQYGTWGTCGRECCGRSP